MENIVHYVNSHMNAQLAAFSASEAGIGALNDMQEKLHFAGDELQRMEDEGGTSLNDEQTAKLDAYYKVMQRIRNVLRFETSRESESCTHHSLLLNPFIQKIYP